MAAKNVKRFRRLETVLMTIRILFKRARIMPKCRLTKVSASRNKCMQGFQSHIQKLYFQHS